MKTVSLDFFVGKTFTAITGLTPGSECVVFTTNDGTVYSMYHEQDCCEDVYLDDVIGDVNDLLNVSIIQAYESTNSSENGKPDDESFTWTFYRFITTQGSVTLRWYGASNGYYSESVSIFAGSTLVSCNS